VWGATWLFKACGDSSYLTKAETYYDSAFAGDFDTWTLCWDDVRYGAMVLLSKLTGSSVYETDCQNWLDYWSVGVKGDRITYTPGGLAWLTAWGSCRYAAATAFCALVYSDFIADTAVKNRYHTFAVNQINYMLGNNPLNGRWKWDSALIRRRTNTTGRRMAPTRGRRVIPRQISIRCTARL
jgi:endoglucanase